MTNQNATSVHQDETPTIKNYEDIASLANDAIKNKDTSVIEEIEDKNHLRYMQKDVEMWLIRKDSIFSIISLDIGIRGIFYVYLL